MDNEAVKRQQQLLQTIEQVDLERATIASVDGYYYRTTNLRYAKDPLATIGAEKYGGRYNFKPPDGYSIPCLYCGEEDLTATTEKFYGLKRSRTSLPPHAVFAIKVTLNHVLDLSDRVYCQAANIDWQGINQPWEYFQDRLKTPSYSQKIGELAYNFASVEAIKFVSTKQPSKHNLAIFTDKLLFSSIVKVYDPKNDLNQI